jgi:hypothetical protein
VTTARRSKTPNTGTGANRPPLSLARPPAVLRGPTRPAASCRTRRTATAGSGGRVRCCTEISAAAAHPATPTTHLLGAAEATQ